MKTLTDDGMNAYEVEVEVAELVPEPVTEAPDDAPLELPEGTLEERLAWVGEPEDVDDRRLRANALWDHEEAAGDSSEGLAEVLRERVYGETEPETEPEPLDTFSVDDHTIPQIQDFVEKNPETAADVLRIETEGQGRTTLLEWLNNRIKPAGAGAGDTTTSEEN